MFLHRFFTRRPSTVRPPEAGEPPDEHGRISRLATLRRLGIAAGGGLLYTLALPPANLSFLVFFALVPPLCLIWRRKPHIAACYGFVWGTAWGVTSFFWLREIEWMLPFVMGPILALWPAAWFAAAAFAFRCVLHPAPLRLEGEAAMRNYPVRRRRLLFLIFGLAALYVGLEFTRSTMLPWNNLSTAMHRGAFFAELLPWTGQFGVGLLIAAVNIALALAIHFRRRGRAARHAALLTAVAVLLIPATAHMLNRAKPAPETRPLRVGVVQGDISQRRHATAPQADEALDIYLELTGKLLETEPGIDLVVWPESAVPVAYRSGHPTGARFRSGIDRLLRKHRTPFLIGSIDFAPLARDAAGAYGLTNSALLIHTPGGRVAAKYDKIHRVPWGEYIPFRRFLPQFIIRWIDMGRDLTPGGDYAPLEIKPGMRAGVAVCFESVFAYIAREEVRRGANFLVAISNDAWYPTSHEPEQHLANGIGRAAETGLPVLRSGNNGGTLVISPKGKILEVLTTPGEGRPEIRRGRGFGVLTLDVPRQPAMTFYVRCGEWLILAAALLAAALLLAAAASCLEEKKKLSAMLNEGAES